MSAPECFEHPWLEDFELTRSDESDDDVNEDKCRNDLTTIKDSPSDEESEVEYGNDEIKIVISDENTNSESETNGIDIVISNNIDTSLLLSSDMLGRRRERNRSTFVGLTDESIDNTATNVSVLTPPSWTVDNVDSCSNKEEETNLHQNNDNSSSENEDDSCEINNEIRNLTSIIEEEHLETVEESSECDSNNNNEEELALVNGLHDSPSQSKALKELSNHRKALSVPSPLSSPVGCRRTFIPSPETVREVEPIKKHQCRRDSDDMNQILKSNNNLVKVEKTKILELDCDNNTDTSATVSKRGSSVIIRKTPITYVRDTKSLVTYYENLLQHA